MRYTIHNFRREVEHLFGDDNVIFRYEIHFTEPEELVVPKHSFYYFQLRDYLKEKHPEFHKYLDDTRKSLDRWGPCEALVMDAIGDEALRQLDEYALEYLMQSQGMQAIFNQYKSWQEMKGEEKEKFHEDFNKKFQELEAHVSHETREQNPYYRFCETVEKHARATATEIFPQIADLDSEGLYEFRYLFVRDIQQMYSNLEKMLKKFSTNQVKA